MEVKNRGIGKKDSARTTRIDFKRIWDRIEERECWN